MGSFDYGLLWGRMPHAARRPPPAARRPPPAARRTAD
jgi:hypothetical protein